MSKHRPKLWERKRVHPSKKVNKEMIEYSAMLPFNGAKKLVELVQDEDDLPSPIFGER